MRAINYKRSELSEELKKKEVEDFMSEEIHRRGFKFPYLSIHRDYNGFWRDEENLNYLESMYKEL